MKGLLLVPALAFALSGCFFVKKSPAGTTSQPSTVEPKNHGQERSEEVHERNAERKEAKDEAKADKKNDK
jgi:hypothetical protein